MSYLKYLYKDEFIKLIIEEDAVGFYLIVYKNPNTEKSDADYLVDSLEEAFKEANERFQISKEQWQLQEN